MKRHWPAALHSLPRLPSLLLHEAPAISAAIRPHVSSSTHAIPLLLCTSAHWTLLNPWRWASDWRGPLIWTFWVQFKGLSHAKTPLQFIVLQAKFLLVWEVITAQHAPASLPFWWNAPQYEMWAICPVVRIGIISQHMKWNPLKQSWDRVCPINELQGIISRSPMYELQSTNSWGWRNPNLVRLTKLERRLQSGSVEGWEEEKPYFTAPALRGSFKIDKAERTRRRGEDLLNAWETKTGSLKEF